MRLAGTPGGGRRIRGKDQGHTGHLASPPRLIGAGSLSGYTTFVKAHPHPALSLEGEGEEDREAAN
jgi:hypothetical protein